MEYIGIIGSDWSTVMFRICNTIVKLWREPGDVLRQNLGHYKPQFNPLGLSYTSTDTKCNRLDIYFIKLSVSEMNICIMSSMTQFSVKLLSKPIIIEKRTNKEFILWFFIGHNGQIPINVQQLISSISLNN